MKDIVEYKDFKYLYKQQNLIIYVNRYYKLSK